MGEIGSFIRGAGIQKKDLGFEGVPAIHYGQIFTHYGIFAEDTKSYIERAKFPKARKANFGDLVIATTSENDEDLCKAVAWLGNEPSAISSDALIFSHTANPKYIAYFFASDTFQSQKTKYITGTKVRRISKDSLAKISIPLPSQEEQQRIVDILDRFDALVNDISSGLPAEIAARRKQYEYYRDQLLTFKELEPASA